MTPTIIKAETHYNGMVIVEWYRIDTFGDTPGRSRITRDEGQAIVRGYSLPLAYKDENGEVYADGGGCFARYLALKDLRKQGKEQMMLYYEEKHRITQFLANW